METYTKDCIDASKRLIDSYLFIGTSQFNNDFSEYSPFYKGTNESISSYMPLIDMTDYHNALAVLSSGDHAFNLIHSDIMDIDTFDSNKLTEYYALGIKRAMIMKYSYIEYLHVLIDIIYDELSSEEEIELIKGLLPYMESEHRKYWKGLLSYSSSVQNGINKKLPLLKMLSKPAFTNPIALNSYLKSKEDYDKLKGRIGNANIRFTYCNAIDLASKMPGNYDVIMFSNILDYFYMEYGYLWGYDKLKAYEEKTLPLLSENGVAFLAYIYSYCKDPFFWRKIIMYSDICAFDINGEHENIMPFKGYDYNGENQINSAMLVLRKKGKGERNG